MQRTTLRAALLVAVALSVPVAAHAQAAGEDARAAYDRGAAAHARADYRAAASEFAQADALAPNAVALKAALDEALLADDPELGMQLVERARVRAPGDASLAPSVRDATRRFAGRTGRVKVDCGGRSCAATIDARAMEPAAPMIVLVGPHRIAIAEGGRVTSKDVVVAGDREVDVVLPAPAPPPELHAPPSPASARPHPAHGASGLSPAWFVAAAAATVVAGGLAIASGIDTANQHSTFVGRGCDHGADSTCSGLAADGVGAQTRTDVLAAITGALGVTAVSLAFLVHWRSASTEPASASLVIGDRAVAVRFLF